MEQPRFPDPRPYSNEPSTDNFWPLALAWGFVGIPLLWGTYGALINAMKLFE